MRICRYSARARLLAAGFAGLLLCGAAPAGAASAPGNAASARVFAAAAQIVPATRPLQCVPYARKVSGISIRGDAWTWWASAASRYERGQAPRVGAVLVMKKTKRLRRGHLAVVKRIIDSRTIIVDQANWLNRGKIHLDTAVLDVSPRNDWSAVRVWYTPGARFGSGTYAAHGFIYPKPQRLQTASATPVPLPRRRPEPLELASTEASAGKAARPAQRAGKASVGPGKTGSKARPPRLAPRRVGHGNLARDGAHRS